MTGLANRFVSLVALGALAFGAYHVAPEETRAFVASAGDLAKAAVATLPGGSESAEGLNLPNPADLLSTHFGDTNASAEDHSFLVQDPDGTPVRWDPCTPIRVVVNTNQASAGALEDVHGALARITEVTGLTFSVEGLTDEIPQSDRYTRFDANGNYLPLIIAWSGINESDMFQADNDSGRATANPAVINGERRYVTGAVILNSGHNDLYAPGFGPGATRGNLLLHEIGHAVGLGHTEANGEIMSTQIGPATPDSYAVGDLAGLSQLGSARGCAA